MIGLISHDAGGAEILSSFARRNSEEFVYALDGPARKVFERKLGAIPMVSLDEAVARASSIISGTSWQSDIEIEAIGLAREQGKPSVAFLDHWVNYRERFERGGTQVLPDELWVGDRWAESIARSCFPESRIRLVDNPYLQEMRQQLASVDIGGTVDKRTSSVLYVCEPIAEHALLRHQDPRHWGYTEADALRYFLNNVSLLGRPVDRILLRPHPSEKPGKYDWVPGEFDLPIELGGENPLVEEIAASDVVVGCESMALVIALIAEKQVWSCIPPGGRPCVLPHDGITHLRDLSAP